MLDQKPMRTRCLGGFSFMWVPKFLISPVKERVFVQKWPNLAQIWHFCPLLAHLVPCWWVGWWLWRVGCVSQDIYFIVSLRAISVLINTKQLNEFRFTSIDPQEHNWESDLLVSAWIKICFLYANKKNTVKLKEMKRTSEWTRKETWRNLWEAH